MGINVVLTHPKLRCLPVMLIKISGEILGICYDLYNEADNPSFA